MFYSYDLNYDIIFEIKTIIMTFVLVVTPSHPDKTIFFLPAQWRRTTSAIVYCCITSVLYCDHLPDECDHYLISDSIGVTVL